MEKVPIGKIFGTYYKISKKYPISGVLTFLVYGLGTLIAEVYIKLYYRDIFDVIAVSDHSPETWNTLWQLLLIIIGLNVLFNAFWRIGDFLLGYHESNVMREITNMCLEKLQQHSYNFFAGNFSGSLVAKTRRFVRAYETIHDKIIFNFWQTGVQLIGVSIVLVMTHTVLGTLFIIWVVYYLVLSFYLMKARMKYDVLVSEEDSNVTGNLSDSITNILNVKIFSSSASELARFGLSTQKEYKARVKAWTIGNAFYAIQAFSMFILEIGGMYFVLRLWMEQSVSAGTVILMQAFLYTVMFKTWEIGKAMSDFFKAISDASEMIDIIEQPLGVQDIETPEQCTISKGAVQMQNVSFGYTQEKSVFTNFSLHIPSGQKVGIVGHSGSGKSTLFKLLMRFIDIQEGHIFIDEQDIQRIVQDDLRRNVSYVPQEPILFHRSLYENIAYAKPDATEADVHRAAKQAHAHDFIEGLPHGYQTLVGERGIKLSGGERQRVAIARAILKNAPILLLDEATSSLDSLSEKYIQEQLQVLMKNRTTLAIAHRISTIAQMDRIIVLDKGYIAEDGMHEDLLQKNGIYAELWQHQSDGFLVE